MATPMTTEESFLWQVARSWRQPDSLEVPGDLDWERIAEVAIPNRMATLLRNTLQTAGSWDLVPEAPRGAIEESVDRLAANAELLGRSLSQYLEKAGSRGLDTVVLKGLAISCNVYGDAAMRPGGDIDILVPRSQVGESIALLDEMGIGTFWPNLMADPYYERHHLHHQRSDPDLKVWYEIHWALDHPYTLLTIDYDDILQRASLGELLGAPVRELAPPDLILSLAVHLVKHAVYLPDAHQRSDLPRLVLADGMLMYYLDIAETIHVYRDSLDWDALAALARRSGTVAIIGSVLRACRTLLGTPVPDTVLEGLPVPASGALTRYAMHKVVDREIAQYLGEPPSRFWDAMLVTNGAFILRPIRLLESAAYFLPPGEYFRRRYGRSSMFLRAGHVLRALFQFSRFAFDSVYFAIERHLRLKRIGYNTSLFNRLETEG